MTIPTVLYLERPPLALYFIKEAMDASLIHGSLPFSLEQHQPIQIHAILHHEDTDTRNEMNYLVHLNSFNPLHCPNNGALLFRFSGIAWRNCHRERYEFTGTWDHIAQHGHLVLGALVPSLAPA